MPENTVRVALVADRENHHDTIFGTNLTWAHKGDVQKVDELTWQKMAKHEDVYALATDENTTPTPGSTVPTDLAPKGEPKPFDYKLLTEEQQKNMSMEQLVDMAAMLEYELNPRLKEPNLRIRFAERTKERLEDQLELEAEEEATKKANFEAEEKAAAKAAADAEADKKNAGFTAV